MPGQRRSSEEWEELLSEFDAGTETAAEFCRRKELKSSNFYKQRAARVGDSSPAFVVARRAAPSAPLSAAPITVQVNDVIIRCDSQASVAWVSELVATLC